MNSNHAGTLIAVGMLMGPFILAGVLCLGVDQLAEYLMRRRLRKIKALPVARLLK